MPAIKDPKAAKVKDPAMAEMSLILNRFLWYDRGNRWP